MSRRGYRNSTSYVPCLLVIYACSRQHCNLVASQPKIPARDRNLAIPSQKQIASQIVRYNTRDNIFRLSKYYFCSQLGRFVALIFYLIHFILFALFGFGILNTTSGIFSEKSVSFFFNYTHILLFLSWQNVILKA